MAEKPKTIFVGLSGGVDSAVCAALLKKQGHIVVGVFIRTWQPDFIECSFREDRLDAMRVASHLGIPFLECDAEEVYKEKVAEYMINEYRIGRTPNPDVMCNREIKFGVFWDFAKKHGADFIATGHYARITDASESKVESQKPARPNGHSGRLKVAADATKDQAYFLYRLTNNDLKHIMFPLGGILKSEVRSLAKKFGLPNAVKKDSQGICMLGDLDIKKFLEHYIPSKRGDVLNESGEVVGYHDGALFLTLGERHGFTITKKTPNDNPHYIVGKDIEKNTIIVSDIQNQKKVNNGILQNYGIENISWVHNAPEVGKKYTAQIRYHGKYLACKYEDGQVIFDEPVLVAKGQSIVIFDNDECLGGGIVS